MGEEVAVEGDFDLAGRRQDVDPFEGVLGVHVDGLVFFEPLVHGAEVQADEVRERGGRAGEVGVEGEDEVGGLRFSASVRGRGGGQGVLGGDGGLVGGGEGFAFGELEGGVTVGDGEEVGFRNVELGVVGVFPDVVGGSGPDNVDATEEYLHLPWGREGLDGALVSKAKGEFLEFAGSWVSLGNEVIDGRSDALDHFVSHVESMLCRVARRECFQGDLCRS